jgi:hypothetical protein
MQSTLNAEMRVMARRGTLRAQPQATAVHRGLEAPLSEGHGTVPMFMAAEGLPECSDRDRDQPPAARRAGPLWHHDGRGGARPPAPHRTNSQEPELPGADSEAPVCRCRSVCDCGGGRGCSRSCGVSGLVSGGGRGGGRGGGSGVCATGRGRSGVGMDVRGACCQCQCARSYLLLEKRAMC